MTLQTYDIIAWCDRTFYASVRIEATSPEQALETARHGIHDADGEECDGAWAWDRFRVEDVNGNILLEYQDDDIRLRIAARDLLAVLRAVLPYAESELSSLHECRRRDGGLELEGEVTACEAAIERALQVIIATQGRSV